MATTILTVTISNNAYGTVFSAYGQNNGLIARAGTLAEVLADVPTPVLRHRCDYCGIAATYAVREEEDGVITRYVCSLHTQALHNKKSILELIGA